MSAAGPMTDADRAAIHEWLLAQRRAQGLPDHIEDPAAIAEIVAWWANIQRDRAHRTEAAS